MNRTYPSSSIAHALPPDRDSTYCILTKWVGRATAAVIAAMRRNHHRRIAIRQLAELSDHTLYDIGLSRGLSRRQIREVVDGMRTPAQLEAEHAKGRKPMYQVPRQQTYPR